MAELAASAPPRTRTAVLVDYENVYFEDKKAYGGANARGLADALMLVASRCGSVTMARAYAPFANHPAAAKSFHDAGFEPVYCGDVKGAADLRLVEDLAVAGGQEGVGLVFLATGDRDMLEALRKAQERGARVAVVSCSERALSPKMKAAADKVFLAAELMAEAARFREGKPGKLGLERLIQTQPATPAQPVPARPEKEPPPRSAPAKELPGAAAAGGPSGLTGAGESTGFTAGPGEFRTSSSALKTYSECPRRYRLVHLEKRREPARPETFAGECVHRALKKFYDLKPAERTLEALDKALRWAWGATRGRREAFPPGRRAEEAAKGIEVVGLLKTYFRQRDVRAVAPVATEVFLTTSVGDGVTITGRIDRVDELPRTGELLVIDYKTGKVPGPRPALTTEFQLPLYYAMVVEAYARPVKGVVLDYLAGPEKYEYYPRAEDVQRAKEKVASLVARIRSDREFAPRVSALCGFCPFLPECPARGDYEKRASGGTGGTEPPEDDLPF